MPLPQAVIGAGAFGSVDVEPSDKAAISAETLRAADALRRALTQVQRRLRALRADHGVNASKLIILGRLHQAKAPLTATDLAQMERLQPQSLTRSIAELDAAAFIVRRQDGTDKRQVRIEITQAGRDVLIADARAQTAWLAEKMDLALSDTERGMLALTVSLLERLI